MIEVEEFEAPAYWASYLINGDASDLDDVEQAECDAWVESLEGFAIVSTKEDEEEFYFTWNGLLTGGLTYVGHRQ